MGVITKPSRVQRSVIVQLLVSCGMAVGSGHTRPPAVASRGSIPQTRPPAQGAAHAAADPDRTQKTGDFSTFVPVRSTTCGTALVLLALGRRPARRVRPGIARFERKAALCPLTRGPPATPSWCTGCTEWRRSWWRMSPRSIYGSAIQVMLARAYLPRNTFNINVVDTAKCG